MEKKEKKNGNNIAIFILSTFYVILSILLLYIPKLEVVLVCYGICIASIVLGIYYIVKYFVTDCYRNIEEYGFSMGVLFVILGLCGMMRAEKLASVFIVIMGFGLLILGVVLLQYSLDLKRFKDPVWIVEIVLSIGIILGGVVIVTDPFHNAYTKMSYIYYFMLGAGIVSLFSMLYIWIKIHLYNHKMKKEATLQTVTETESTEMEITENKEEMHSREDHCDSISSKGE